MVRILVFVGADCISASKVYDGCMVFVSFCGEDSMSYDDIDDLNDFRQCVLSDLGLNAFTDAEIDLLFIDCGANKENIDCLYNLCRDAAKVNVVSIEKVLPLVTLNRGLGKNETKVFSFGDLSWTVESHAEDKSVTVHDADGAEGVELEPEDFCLLYEFRAMVQSDEEEIAKIKAECQSEIEKYMAEMEANKVECTTIQEKAKDINNLVKDEKYKYQLVSRFTDNKEILNNLDAVACNQEELDNLLLQNKNTFALENVINSRGNVNFGADLEKLKNQKIPTIYLFYKELKLTEPEKVKNVKLSGVFKSVLEIPAKTFINFQRNGVTFDNLRFDNEYRKVFAKYFKKPGDIVTMGKWKGKDIQWQVLEVKDGKALLITKEPVEQMAFDKGNSNRWESSTLRKWLNNEFSRQAFKDFPEGTILDTELNDVGTTDKVFLLSKEEVRQLWKCDVLLSGCKDKNCSWWLRSPYPFDSHDVYFVPTDGILSANADRGNVSARPACWVNLESEIFYS